MALARKSGEHVIADKFFFQIFHVGFGCPRFQGIGLNMGHVVHLTEVGRKRDHFTIICFDQPFEK